MPLVTSSQTGEPIALNQMLANHFNLEELEELCFILGVRYDDLTGQTISAKALALQTHFKRRNQLVHLVDQLKILRPAVDWAAFTPAEPEAEPPYKGLHYFSEADSDLFFGRKVLTADLISHLNNHRFLAVVGASGSGKSSLVRAGIIPEVRRGKIKINGQSSIDWPIHILTPGDEPVKALAASLTHQFESVTAMKTLLNDLRNDGQSLDLWIYRQFIDQPDSRLLLVVDQFEELFTQCGDFTERSRFIENLTHALQSGKQRRLTLILTLRADFYAHAATYESLRPLLESAQKIVGAMSTAELRQVIEEPAEAYDWHYQLGLVDLILRDLGAIGRQRPNPGTLPLLSHALLETWRRREGRLMTLAGYQAAGGVYQAIAATADAIYTSMTPQEQAIARHIFLQLTELGQSTEDTRRRVQLTTLTPNDVATEAFESVLNRLVKNRLVVVNNDTAEVTHEALIRAWPALRGWLDENRINLKIQRQLTNAANAWLELNQDAGTLYRGLRLVQAEVWAQEYSSQLSELERRFLTASRATLVAEEQTQMQARRRAQRTPIFSFVGGSLGFALSFLLLASPTVENQNLLLVLMVLRLISGGLTGFFLLFFVDLAVTNAGLQRWIAWPVGGGVGGGIFALLLYFDALLRLSAANSSLSYAAVAGLAWGLPAGLGRVWMLKYGRYRWQHVFTSVLLCGLVLMLMNLVNPVIDAPDLLVLLAGAIMPFAIFMSAYLADPEGESKK